MGVIVTVPCAGAVIGVVVYAKTCPALGSVSLPESVPVKAVFFGVVPASSPATGLSLAVVGLLSTTTSTVTVDVVQALGEALSQT